MRSRPSLIALAVGGGLAACGLFPDLSGLSGDGGADAPALDAPIEAGPADGGADATDAQCPTITRVALQTNTGGTESATATITMDVTQGDLLVAILGAQFAGTLSLGDSANNAWIVLPGADNLSCVTDASPWETRSRIAYAIASSTTSNDAITWSTTSSSGDYLEITVAEYATSGTFSLTTSAVEIPDAATDLLELAPMQTTSCRSLVVAMVGDEYPGGDTWTPLPGFAALSTNGDWSYVAIANGDAGPGTVVAGASHLFSETCGAVAGAVFAAQ